MMGPGGPMGGGNIPQMMVQAMMQGCSPMSNPMIQDMMRLKQQGVDATTAAQQLAQKYPQFRQAMPFLANKSPQQMDQAASNALQQAGVAPGELMQQFQRYL